MTNQSIRLNKILMNLELGKDGIYSSDFVNTTQENEIEMREVIANVEYDDYLDAISHHHSIPVMDWEVKRILRKLDSNAIILDIGGCWGWHWRDILSLRPNVKIVIIDFVRQNLLHAKNILKGLVNQQIFLVHADALQLPFDKNSFDLTWTVQAFQHIPNFDKAVNEAYRVLIRDGIFINYSLNRAFAMSLIYKIFGKHYHIEGETESYIFNRANQKQSSVINDIFNSKVNTRYTEIFLQPEIKLFTGGANNLIGKIDAILGSSLPLLKWFARQRSYEVVK